MNRVIFKGEVSNVLTSPQLDNEYERGYISIKYYSDGSFSTLATPTAGTSTFQGSEDGEIFASISNGNINAKNVGVGESYSRPTFSGDIRYVKVTFTGVLGATHAQIIISQYGA